MPAIGMLHLWSFFSITYVFPVWSIPLTAKVPMLVLLLRLTMWASLKAVPPGDPIGKLFLPPEYLSLSEAMILMRISVVEMISSCLSQQQGFSPVL